MLACVFLRVRAALLKNRITGSYVKSRLCGIS